MKFSIIAAFALTAAFVVPAQAQQAKQDFDLVNQTGYDIKEVYVSPSKANNWEEDVLGDDELGNNSKTHIKFNRSNKTCSWDLEVVYSEDDSNAVWKDINLCKVARITLKYNRKTDTTTAFFD